MILELRGEFMGSDRGSRSETSPTRWAYGVGEETSHPRGTGCPGNEVPGRRCRANHRVSAERWTAVVAVCGSWSMATTRGAGRVVLSVEEPDEPTVMIAVGREGPSLTAAREDTLICVRASDAYGVSTRLNSDCVPDRAIEIPRRALSWRALIRRSWGACRRVQSGTVRRVRLA